MTVTRINDEGSDAMSSRCRCGKTLPDVSDDEVPYEFCSSRCRAAVKVDTAINAITNALHNIDVAVFDLRPSGTTARLTPTSLRAAEERLHEARFWCERWRNR
jgi:hypothetical protein